MADQNSAVDAANAAPDAGRFGSFDLGFGALMLLCIGWFAIWGIDYTNSSQVLIFLLAGGFGLFMAFNIGGNDVANSFGTSVGAGTITMKQALAIAAVFEVSGAVIAGGEVTSTIRSGIVDLSGVAIDPMQFAFVMMSALLAASLWLMFASSRGLPVSTTHSIIGGIVGSSIALGILIAGRESALALVQWDKITQIAISWILSPVLGGVVSYVLYSVIKKFIGNGASLHKWVPFVAALGAAVIASMLLFKGLSKLDLNLSQIDNFLIMAMVATGAWMATYVFARSMRGEEMDRSTFVVFSWLQVCTACAFAFSHGANDIANAIGPFAAVLDVLRTGEINAEAPIPTTALVCFGIALIVGLWFIGKEVIKTVGTHLTKMHPASGFAAELAAAAVVLLASIFGLPVSSTHILIGAVLGIGIANSATNWKLMRPIFSAWVITLPAAGGLSALFLVIMNAVL